jgi:hypothetical protein
MRRVPVAAIIPVLKKSDNTCEWGRMGQLLAVQGVCGPGESSGVLCKVGFYEPQCPTSLGSPECTKLVYTGAMAASKQVRRSVTLPAQVAQQVERMAKRRRLSDNRVLLELIEEGIEARRQKEKNFFQLAERFRSADDPEQVKRLGDELGRFVFGE